MRSIPVFRAIAAATALTLATSGVVAAQQIDTRFPNPMSAELLSAVVTSALDDDTTNKLIESTAGDYHAKLGGKTSKPVVPKKNAKKAQSRGGWLSFPPFEDTAHVTQAVLDVAGGFSPNLILVSGGDWKANVGIARSNTSSVIVDMGQPAPCLSANGQPDDTGVCEGATSAIPGNYAAIEFAVEEAAYLVGVVAARESRGQPLGIISGYQGCLECERYVIGFTNGARSVEPEIEIVTAYYSDDEASAFGHPASAKTYAEAFVDVYQPGVVLPVGRAATMAMVEAACAAGARVIGAGIDISTERPDLDCVMASITKDTARAVEEAMFSFSFNQNAPVTTYDLNNEGVAVTDEWRLAATKRVDTNDFYLEAETALRTGQVDPCPEGCNAGLDVTSGEIARDDGLSDD
jgi:hypothetical protein